MNTKLINAALCAAEELAVDVLLVQGRTDVFVELLISLPKGTPRPCNILYPNLNRLLDQITKCPD